MQLQEANLCAYAYACVCVCVFVLMGSTVSVFTRGAEVIVKNVFVSVSVCVCLCVCDE